MGSIMKTYLKVVFLLIVCTTFFLSSAENELSYGDEVKTLLFEKNDGTNVDILKPGELNFLIFFNVSVTSHWRTLSEIDFLIQQQKKNGCEIVSYAISASDPTEFESISKSYKSKFILINDASLQIHQTFDFECGQCLKFVIIDNEGILRFNASYVDLYMLEHVISRYCKKEEDN